MGGVTLTTEEAKALFELIDQETSGNAGNVFAHDDTDSMEDVTTRACVKLFTTAGRGDLVPDNLR